MKINKIITLIAIIIIIAGIVVTATVGLNVDMKTNEHNQILLSIDKEYNLADIMEITKEVFEDETVDVQKAGSNNKQVLISAKTITEEQKTNVITKVNEKFETEITAEDIEITTAPRTKISSMITPYIFPIILAIVLIIVYSVIRYKSLGVLRVITQYILGIALIGLLTFSIIAISRIEMGTITVSALFTCIALSIYANSSIFENKLQSNKIAKEQNNK